MAKQINITVTETDIDCTSLIAMLVKEMLEKRNNYTNRAVFYSAL